MKLEIRGIESAGDLERERLVLRATTDLDVGRYVILPVTALKEGRVAGGAVAGAYWIPNKNVKLGDFVVVYTKKGVGSEKVGASGANSHFFYWGKPEAVWDKGKAAVVVEIATWGGCRPDDVPTPD